MKRERGAPGHMIVREAFSEDLAPAIDLMFASFQNFYVKT